MNARATGLGRILAATAIVGSLASSGSGAAPRAAAPLKNIPNLEGYWPLDAQTGGVTPDLSGNSPANDGTLTGGAALDTTQKSPVPAGNVASLKTDASSATHQFVDVPNAASLQITGPMTLAAWVFPGANTGVGNTPDAQKAIIHKWTGGGTGINGYFLQLTGDSTGNNTPVFSMGNGSTQTSATDAAQISLTTWTHVAGVFDGTNMVLYVNGSSVATVPSGAVPTSANTQNLHVGADYGVNVFTGNIDEARVYSFGATAGQVGTLFAGSQPPPTGTAAASGPQEITVTWTAAANARSYNIYRSVNGGAFALYANATGTSYTDTGAVDTASMYAYQVTAVACLESAPDTATAPLSPGVALPRVPGHESNNLAHRCGCSSIPPGAGAGAALLALAFLFALRRKPA